MSYTKRFFGFSVALAVAATAQLAAWPQPAAADPAAAPVAAPVAEAAVASSEPEPLSAKDRKYLEDIGTAAAEVIEDCYADSENERDPHYAPDWCEQKANTVAMHSARKRPSRPSDHPASAMPPPTKTIPAVSGEGTPADPRRQLRIFM